MRPLLRREAKNGLLRAQQQAQEFVSNAAPDAAPDAQVSIKERRNGCFQISGNSPWSLPGAESRCYCLPLPSSHLTWNKTAYKMA